jgi:hypothetical protein
MAAGRSIGTVFCEIDLDSSRYLRSQKQLLKDATSTSLSIEQNFKNLGVRSSAEFDLMRAKISNSYNMIASNAKATANDILRAEQAKNAQLKALNEQQFGHHVGLLQNLKSNYFQISTSIAASIYAIQQVAAPFVRIFEKGFMAVETYGQSVASLAAMVVTFTERQEGVSLSDQWKEALAYSTEMVPILENIAAKTLLSGQETTALANAFARAGVFLDASNAKQMESFTRVSNALPLLTQGQEIMRQINTEIRAVMTGSNEAASMMLQTLKAVDPEIEKNLKTWRAEGTVMEHLGDLLSGFGPATALLENQWQAVKSTIDATVTQVLRGGMKPAYDEIITRTKDINAFLDEHRGMVQGGIRIGWMTIQDLAGTAKGLVSGMLPMLSDMGKGVGIVAYGWGGVLAVLKPVGAFLGNSVAITWELAKMIGNSVVAIGALATMQTDVAQVAWSEAKRGFASVEKYSAANRDLLVNGIADAVAGYGNRTTAALASDKAVSNSAAASKQFQAKNINALAEEHKAGAKKRETAEKQLEAEIEKTINERQKLTGNLYVYKAQEIERDLNRYREAGVAEVNIARLKTEKIKNLYEEVSKAWRESMAKWDDATLKKIEAPSVDYGVTQEMLTAYSTLYSGIVARSQEAADVQEALIYEQGNKFYEVTQDEVAIAQWEAEQLEKLFVERAGYSNSWADGVKAGLIKIKNEQTGWGATMIATTTATYKSMADGFSSIFYDAVTGDLKSIKEYTDSIWKSIAKEFTNEIGKMASKEIILLFKSQWTAGGSDVLKMVNSVLGIANTAISWLGSSSTTTTTVPTVTDGAVIAYQGGRIPFEDGGKVPGLARYSGDHPGNDTVPGWLSPEEVVIRRTAVTAETGPTLDYINRFRRLPPGIGLYNGGSVAGTVTDQPGRGYWGFDDFLNLMTVGTYGGLTGNYGDVGDLWAWANFQGVEFYKKAIEGDFWDIMDALFDPATGPGLTKLLNLSGGEINKVFPIVGELVEIIAPVIGGIIGGIVSAVGTVGVGSPAGIAGGAAAGSGIASKFNQETNKEALIKAATTAAVSYVAASAGQYVSEAGGGMIGGKIANAAVGYATKYAINSLVGSVLPIDQVQSGQMTVSYAGSNAASILGGLSERMNALATKDYTVSAKNGLDYVPYDGMIVKTHRGEAVITEEENRERRSGAKNSKAGDTYNLNFYGPVYDKDGLARDLVPAIDKARKARVHG